MGIKQFRKRHKLSQRQLAVLLKVNYRTIQHWEAGTRTPHNMTIELLKRLDKELTANDLLGLCVCGNPKLPESD